MATLEFSPNRVLKTRNDDDLALLENIAEGMMNKHQLTWVSEEDEKSHVECGEPFDVGDLVMSLDQ